MPVVAKLLGSPVLDADGERHELTASKRAALIAYAATHAGDWVSRDDLTLLLWGDRPETKARRALRQMLHELSGSPLGSALEVEEQRLRFVGACDAVRVFAAAERSAWSELLEAWTGPFLDGWALPREPAVDSWIAETREAYAALRRDALRGRSSELERLDDVAGAAELLGEVWREDVLETDVVVRQLWLLQKAGRSRASAEARAFQSMFERDMGSPPDGDVGAVVAAAIVGRPLAEPESVAHVERGPAPLSRSATPFIGRRAELRQGEAHLADHDVRLVSLIGIGGTGKTRLALELAHRAAETGREVGWASLVGIENPHDVATALTSAWGLEGPNAGRLDALSDRIGSAEALLVIDNAEDLVQAVHDATSALLARCPKLTILVTSRRALDTRGEHRIFVGGLSIGPGEDGVRSDASELLVASARRRNPDFEDPEAAAEEIAGIVGGHPLALELVGSWSDVLTVDDMLADVRAGLDALGPEAADGLSDIPTRQRGLRAVLDASWNRLRSEARAAMLALAPCQGGFDTSAARALGVSRAELRELSAAALLYREGRRFARHPLVAQDARERARTDAARWRELRAAHGRHYFGRLVSLHRDAMAQAGRAVTRAIAQDVENVRQALVWALGHANFDDVHRALTVLGTLERAGVPSAPTFRDEMRAAAEASGDPRILDTVTLYFWEELEDPSLTRDVLERARARGDARIEAHALLTLARWNLAGGKGERDERHGNLERAERYSRGALALRRDLATSGTAESLIELAASYGQLSDIAVGKSEYAAARHNTLRAAALCRRAGLPERADSYLQFLVEIDHFTGAYRDAVRVFRALEASRAPHRHAEDDVELEEKGGWALMYLGRLDEAEEVFLRKLDAARELFGEPREHHERLVNGYLAEIEFFRGNLERARELNAAGDDNPAEHAVGARILWAMGERDEARRILEASLDHVRSVDVNTGPLVYPFAVGYIQSALALLCFELGDIAIARTHTREALEIAITRKLPPEAARAFLPAARLRAHDGDTETAARLLGLALACAPVDYGVKLRTARLAEAIGIAPLEPEERGADDAATLLDSADELSRVLERPT